MPKKTDYQNAVRREMEERHAAEIAKTKAARNIHNEMADRHADVTWGERERACECNAC